MSLGNMSGFALLFTFGNIACVFAIGFLVGPMKQIQGMCSQGRIIASCAFLFMMILTVVMAFKTQNLIAVILCVVLQFCAGCWYCLSYIPGAREVICHGCCSGVGV